MKTFLTKKRVTFLTVLTVAAIGAVVGHAYFTASGTGTGSASVGSSTAWVVGQTGSSGGSLYPDASIGGTNVQTKTYHVKNNGNGNQHLAQVAISVANNDGSAWSAQADNTKPACTKNDFSVGAAVVGTTYTDTAVAGTFTPGQDKTTGSVTVEMIDNGANQDNCQGVTVPVYFSAN